MGAAGAVTSAWEMTEDGGSRHRTYEVTDLGRQWLDDAVIDMHGFAATIDRLFGRSEDGPAVGSADSTPASAPPDPDIRCDATGVQRRR